MRLLLDTHIFLWAANRSSRLTSGARKLLDNADAVSVSSATIWEIAIKARLGKIKADPYVMLDAIEEIGFEELPVLGKHTVGVARLPFHHGDPFDRLLVAQAIAETMRFVTADRRLAVYSELVTVV